MNDKKNTGGPAFPITLHAGEKWTGTGSIDGMTLRDYFAAKAMPMLMEQWPIDIFDNDAQHEVAQRCYLMADAMIKAREQ
jgi:phosphoketolase